MITALFQALGTVAINMHFVNCNASAFHRGTGPISSMSCTMASCLEDRLFLSCLSAGRNSSIVLQYLQLVL